MSRQQEQIKRETKIDEAVNEVVRKWWQLEDRVSSVRWRQGKLIKDHIKQLNKAEKSAFYNRMVRETGKTRETLRTYVWFYGVFPDLPERIQQTGIRASKWLIIAKYGSQDIPPQLTQKEVLGMSCKELREFMKEGEPAFMECAICGEALEYEQQGIEWERMEVCNDCKEKATHVDLAIEEAIEGVIRMYGECPKCGGELKQGAVDNFICKSCNYSLQPSELKQIFAQEEDPLEQ